jgi:hypothetical protein
MRNCRPRLRSPTATVSHALPFLTLPLPLPLYSVSPDLGGCSDQWRFVCRARPIWRPATLRYVHNTGSLLYHVPAAVLILFIRPAAVVHMLSARRVYSKTCLSLLMNPPLSKLETKISTQRQCVVWKFRTWWIAVAISVLIGGAARVGGHCMHLVMYLPPGVAMNRSKPLQLAPTLLSFLSRRVQKHPELRQLLGCAPL